MNDILIFLTRALLLAAGLVMALSLAVAALVLLAVWAVYAAIARLMGRPVKPFVMRMGPRAGFERFRERAERAGPSRTPRADANERSVGRGRSLSISDVEPRAPRY